MNQYKLKAFTLVELIVVITILAILGTIAFISLQGYSKSARDSSRVNDINTIKSGLKLFTLQSGYYPEPTNGIDITFSGSEVWTQGEIGDTVINAIQRVNKIPVDPLTSTNYTYSRLNTKGEIEIAAVLEDTDLSHVSQSYAGTIEGLAYVTGDYNGAIAKVSTGSDLYVLAVPTIISGDIGVLDYLSLLDQGKLVINGGESLPASYDGSSFKTDTTNNIGLSTGTIVIYNSGSSLPTNQDELNTFITNYQTAYSGSSLANNGNISAIVNETNPDQLNILGKLLVENNLGGSVIIEDNTTETPSGIKSILDCGLTSGEIIYGTSDGTDNGLTCSDDIMVCNGTTGSGFTINACNLGASVPSFTSTGSFGGLYQWGNNYNSRGGQYTNGEIHPSLTYRITTVQDYSTFSSNGFIEMYGDWTNQDSDGSLRNNQWNPCSNNYHIPTSDEWVNLTSLISLSDIPDLKLPKAGERNWFRGNIFGVGAYGNYHSITPYNDTQQLYRLAFDSSLLLPNSYSYRGDGYSIRCFMD